MIESKALEFDFKSKAEKDGKLKEVEKMAYDKNRLLRIRQGEGVTHFFTATA